MPSMSWLFGDADAKEQPKQAIPDNVPLADAQAMWEALDEGNRKKRPAQLSAEDMDLLFSGDFNPVKPATVPPIPEMAPPEPERFVPPSASIPAPAMTSSTAPMFTLEQLANLLNPMVMPRGPSMPPSTFPYSYVPPAMQVGEPRPANVRHIISGDELDQHVPAPQNEIKYAATANGDECRRKIKEREILRNRDFSSDRILADKVALARLGTTIARLLQQYHQEVAREKELQSYQADWDYCNDMRVKAAYADKMAKHSLDAKNQKLAKAQEEDMCDEEEHEESDPLQFSTAPMQFAEDRALKPLWDQFLAQQRLALEAVQQPMQESPTRSKPKAARTGKKV